MKKVLSILLVMTMCLSTVAFAAVDLGADVVARTANGKVDVSATYTNGTASAVPYWVFTAIYNADGTVKDVHIEDEVAQANMYKEGTNTYSYALADGETAKSFIWDKDTIYAYGPASKGEELFTKSDSFSNISITPAVMADTYQLINNRWYESDGTTVVDFTKQVTLKSEGSFSTGSNDFTYTVDPGTWDTLSDSNGALLIDQTLSKKYIAGGLKINFGTIRSEDVVSVSFKTKIDKYDGGNRGYAQVFDSKGRALVFAAQATGSNGAGVYVFDRNNSTSQNLATTPVIRGTGEYILRYDLDFNKQTVDIYVDGAYVTSRDFYANDFKNGTDEATDVAYMYFANFGGGTPANAGKYSIDDVTVTSAASYDSVEDATGIAAAVTGDMKTGHISQYDLATATAEDAEADGEAGFTSFGESSVATGRTAVTVDGAESEARYIAAVAKLDGTAAEYGFAVNGKKYEALTNASAEGYYGIQLFNVELGTTYEIKPYSIDAAGTVTYGTAVSKMYTGSDYAVEDFSDVTIAAPDLTDWVLGTNNLYYLNGDETTTGYSYNSIPVTGGSVTTSSYFDIEMENGAYAMASIEDNVLSIDKAKYAPRSTANMTIKFDAIKSGTAEISFRYKFGGSNFSNGTNANSFGILMDGATGKRAGGTVITGCSENEDGTASIANQGTRLALRTKRDADTARNTDEIKDAEGNVIGKDTTEWHTVKYIVDMDSQTYDFYYDGVLIGNYPFIEEWYNNAAYKVKSIDRIIFGNVENSGNNTGTLSYCLDDITVIKR